MKLKNQVLPRVYTPHVYVKPRTPQPTAVQTRAYTNRYEALHIEETSDDDDIEETPLIRRVEKVKTPMPYSMTIGIRLTTSFDKMKNIIIHKESCLLTQK